MCKKHMQFDDVQYGDVIQDSYITALDKFLNSREHVFFFNGNIFRCGF